MTDPRPTPAVVLLSGGLDSTTVLAIARDAGFACHTMSFEYGQRHRVELDAARRIAADAGVITHREVRIDLPPLLEDASPDYAGSALTGQVDVPKDRDEASMSGSIPTTYVPARNTIFIALALARAEVVGAADIFLGVNAVDYSGYPDCRPEYIAAYQTLATLATKSGVEGRAVTLHTPLIALSKADIIRRGLSLGVDYARTRSCYDPGPGGKPCLRCDSCLLRLKAFADLDMDDPVKLAFEVDDAR